MFKDMELRPQASERVENIERKLKELNIEKRLMALRADINNKLVEFKMNIGDAKKIIVLGRNELNLLYDAHELLEIESEFKLDFNEKGFIDKVWNMDIYVSDAGSCVDIFGKADNIIYKG